MGSLNVDSLFPNIQHEGTITICTKSIYNQNDTVEDFSKFEFKKRLPSVPNKVLFYFQ